VGMTTVRRACRDSSGVCQNPTEESL
jgi:hypothetical protein